MRQLFWRVQRVVVDRARGVVARVQPRPVVPGSGPLVEPGRRRVLEHVAAHPLVQPDRTSCGSSSLVVLRMLRDPSYAAAVLDAPDPEQAFGRAALGVRRRTNAAFDARGRLQLPWPAALGVRPAAMVRLLDAPEGFGAPGRRYRTLVVDPFAADPSYDAVVRSVSAGEPAPLYVGDGHWMQHIVLVVAADDRRLSVYDPAVGHEVAITRDEFRTGTMAVAGWSRPWLVVLPR